MKKSLSLLMLILSVIASSCFADSGVTSNTITIGQSAALTGPAQQLGIEMRDGATAYFDHINAQGGVNGRQIKLISLDDGYDPVKAADNTKQLIDKENVFSLFGYVGTPTSNASLPFATNAEVPFFGALTGAQSLREPFNRYIFNVRASYFEETEKIIEHSTMLQINKVAVFYQNDAYGKTGLEGVTRALKKRNLDVVVAASVERNSNDVATAVTLISKSNPQAVVMISTYKSCAAFIKEMKKRGVVNPIYWNISFVGSSALSNELGPDGRGVMISQVVPAPDNEISILVKEYRKLYLTKPERHADFVSLEGFISAKIFVEGLKRAGSNLTRDGFIHALEGMSNYDAGGFAVKFGPTNHNASHFVELTVIGKDGQLMH
jgi:ABC-type branched-subunit amino acid transport system substrate-binding protein